MKAWSTFCSPFAVRRRGSARVQAALCRLRVILTDAGWAEMAFSGVISVTEGIRQAALPEQAGDAIVRSAERLERVASILSMLEDKAGSKPVSASEIAAVRCVVESCAADLDAAWAGI